MVNLVVNVILIPRLILFFSFIFIVILNLLISPMFIFLSSEHQCCLGLQFSVLEFILLLGYYHAYVLFLEHCPFVCFQFFSTVIHTPFDLAAHCFCVVPLFSTGMGNVEVLSLCSEFGGNLG